MRYKFNEFAPSGKRQYAVLLGVKDISIMHGLAKNALASFPSFDRSTHPELVDVQSRLRSMCRALAQAEKEANTLGDEGRRKRPDSQERQRNEKRS